MVEGSCHCGQVRWTFEGVPDKAVTCNCTLCRRYGVLWAYDYEAGRIKVEGKTHFYGWGDRTIDFHFCPKCGCFAYGRSTAPEQDGRRRMAVNLRLAEPRSVSAIPVERFEGLDRFESLLPDGRCVADIWF